MKARQNAELELADVQVGSPCLGDVKLDQLINSIDLCICTFLHFKTDQNSICASSVGTLSV